MRLFHEKENLFYLVLFILSFFFLIINDGIFWDTWTIYNQEFNVVFDTFVRSGLPLKGYYDYYIMEYVGVWGGRIIMVLAFFTAGFFLNKSLIMLGGFKSVDRLMLVSFFLVAPVNFARIAFINHPSAIAYMSFFIALFLFLKCLSSEKNKKLIYRLLSLGLFYISFMQASFLVFYGIVPLVFYYWYSQQTNDFFGVLKKAFYYIDFWLLPIFFFIVKSLFFVPYGEYAGYNEVTYDGIIRAFEIMPVEIVNVISDMFNITWTIYLFIPFATLVVLFYFVSLNFIRRKDEPLPITSGTTIIIVLLSSVLLLSLSAFPYLAVGNLLIFADWWSRDQILMPLGISFLFYAAIKGVHALFGVEAGGVLFSVLLSFCIVKNNQVYFSYLVDDIKQQALIEEFKTNKQIRSHTSFLVEDVETSELNALGRIYRFYELSGFMREAFGNQNHFAVNMWHYKGSMEPFINSVTSSSFNIEGHPLNSPEFRIVIKYESGHKEALNKLIKAYILKDRETFQSLKLQLLDLRII